MPVIPSGGFIDVRVLSVLINEPISLHYIVRRTPHTFETEFLFLVREVDLKILRSNNKQLDDINSDKTEAAIRLIINSVCQNSNVYATAEEIKCLKSLGIISPRVPKIALISPSTLIKLLRHFSDDLRAIAFECVLICLLSEFNLLSNTIKNLKSAVYNATETFSKGDPDYQKNSRNNDGVLLHDNKTSTKLMINYHDDKINNFQKFQQIEQNLKNKNDNKNDVKINNFSKLNDNGIETTPYEYQYPTNWQHHYGNDAPALSIPTALDLSEQLAQPLTTHSTNIWTALIDQPTLPALTTSNNNLFSENELANLMNSCSLEEKKGEFLLTNTPNNTNKTNNNVKLLVNKNDKHDTNNFGTPINYRVSDVKNTLQNNCTCRSNGGLCQCCCNESPQDKEQCSNIYSAADKLDKDRMELDLNGNEPNVTNKFTISSNQIKQADTSIYSHRNTQNVPDIFAIEAVVDTKIARGCFVNSQLPSKGLCSAMVGSGLVKKYNPDDRDGVGVVVGHYNKSGEDDMRHDMKHDMKHDVKHDINNDDNNHNNDGEYYHECDVGTQFDKIIKTGTKLDGFQTFQKKYQNDNNNGVCSLVNDTIQLNTFACHEEDFTSILLAYRGAPNTKFNMCGENDENLNNKNNFFTKNQNLSQNNNQNNNLNYNNPNQKYDGIHIILHHPSRSSSLSSESDGSFDSDNVESDNDDDKNQNQKQNAKNGKKNNNAKNNAKNGTKNNPLKRTRKNNNNNNNNQNDYLSYQTDTFGSQLPTGYDPNLSQFGPFLNENSQTNFSFENNGDNNEKNSVNYLTSFNKNLSRHAQTQNFLHRISQQIPLNQRNVRTHILYPAVKHRYNRQETSSYVQFRFAPLSLAFIPFFFIPQIPLSSRQAFLGLCGQYPAQMQFEQNLPGSLDEYFASLDQAKFTNPLDFGKGREKSTNNAEYVAQQTLPAAKLNYLDNRLTLEFIRLIATKMAKIRQFISSGGEGKKKMENCLAFQTNQGSAVRCAVSTFNRDHDVGLIDNIDVKKNGNNYGDNNFDKNFHCEKKLINNFGDYQGPFDDPSPRDSAPVSSPVLPLYPSSRSSLPNGYSNPLTYKSIPFVENPGEKSFNLLHQQNLTPQSSDEMCEEKIEGNFDEKNNQDLNHFDEKKNYEKGYNNSLKFELKEQQQLQQQLQQQQPEKIYSIEHIFSPKEDCLDCRRDLTNFYLGLPMCKLDVDNGFANVPFMCICDIPRHKKRDVFMSKLYYPYYRSKFFPPHLRSLEGLLSDDIANVDGLQNDLNHNGDYGNGNGNNNGKGEIIGNQFFASDSANTGSKPYTNTITALNNPYELPDNPLTFKSMPYLEPLLHSDTNFISTPGIVPFSTLFSVVSLYSRHNYPFESFLKDSAPCQVDKGMNDLDVVFIRYLTFINSQSFLWLLSLKQPVVWASTILEFDKELMNSFFPKNKTPDAYLCNDIPPTLIQNPFKQGVYGVNNPFSGGGNDDGGGVDGGGIDIVKDECFGGNTIGDGDVNDVSGDLGWKRNGNNQYSNPLLGGKGPIAGVNKNNVKENFTIIENLINNLNTSLENKIEPGILQTPVSQTISARLNKKQSQKALFPTFSSFQNNFPYEITKETLPLWRSLLYHIEETLSPLHQLRLLRLCNLLTVVNPTEKVTIPSKKILASSNFGSNNLNNMSSQSSLSSAVSNDEDNHNNNNNNQFGQFGGNNGQYNQNNQNNDQNTQFNTTFFNQNQFYSVKDFGEEERLSDGDMVSLENVIKPPIELTNLNYHYVLGEKKINNKKFDKIDENNHNSPQKVGNKKDKSIKGSKNDAKSSRGRKTIDHHAQRLISGETDWDGLPTWVKEKLAGGELDPNRFQSGVVINGIKNNIFENGNNNNYYQNNLIPSLSDANNVNNNNDGQYYNYNNAPLSANYSPHSNNNNNNNNNDLIQSVLTLGNSIDNSNMNGNYNNNNNNNFFNQNIIIPSQKYLPSQHHYYNQKFEPQNGPRFENFFSNLSPNYPTTSSESTPQYNNYMNSTDSDCTPPYPGTNNVLFNSLHQHQQQQQPPQSIQYSPQYQPQQQQQQYDNIQYLLNQPIQSNQYNNHNHNNENDFGSGGYNSVLTQQQQQQQQSALQYYDLNMALSIQNDMGLGGVDNNGNNHFDNETQFGGGGGGSSSTFEQNNNFQRNNNNNQNNHQQNDNTATFSMSHQLFPGFQLSPQLLPHTTSPLAMVNDGLDI